MNKPILTPEKFDAIVSRMTPVTSRDVLRIIWTLPAIGHRIGMGVDFVRSVLMVAPGNPVRELGGRYYVFEEDLIRFLKNPSQTTETNVKPLCDEGTDEA